MGFRAMSQVTGIVDRDSQGANIEVRDWLTGLPTQYLLWRNLQRELRRSRGINYCFAVLFLDVDRFKAVNDSYGHLAGDKVLRAVARHIRASVRPDDEVFRFGGDEFIVLMKGTAAVADVARIAQRLGRELIARGTTLEGGKWLARVTMSVGGAIVSCNGSSAEAIERAD